MPFGSIDGWEEGKRSTRTIRHGRQRIVVLKQPIGVCGAITPWNSRRDDHPQGGRPRLGLHDGAEAASQTLFALALCELAERAGVRRRLLRRHRQRQGDRRRDHIEPDGAQVTSPLDRIGKLLMAQCAATVRRLDGVGAQRPFIVFDDAISMPR